MGAWDVFSKDWFRNKKGVWFWLLTLFLVILSGGYVAWLLLFPAQPLVSEGASTETLSIALDTQNREPDGQESGLNLIETEMTIC